MTDRNATSVGAIPENYDRISGRSSSTAEQEAGFIEIEVPSVAENVRVRVDGRGGDRRMP